MITYDKFMNKYLEETSKGQNIAIYQGSFLQKFLFPINKHSFIVKNLEKPFVNKTNAAWNLQKNVWVALLNRHSEREEETLDSYWV